MFRVFFTFNLWLDSLKHSVLCIGTMPYTVYRIHDTTNHLLTNCLWFVQSFVYQFIQQFIQSIVLLMFFLCSIHSIVITITLIMITYNWFTTKNFVANLSLIINQLNYHTNSYIYFSRSHVHCKTLKVHS